MSGVLVRPASVDDADAIAAIYAPIVTYTAISFEVDAPSSAVMAERIERLSESHAYLVAEIDGVLAGYAYGGTHRPRAAYATSAEVTAYVAQQFRGQGVGLALYRDLLPKLTARGYHAAFAGITLPNEASVALHTRAGFAPVGVFREVGQKFGRFYDVGWWQRFL